MHSHIFILLTIADFHIAILRQPGRNWFHMRQRNFNTVYPKVTPPTFEIFDIYLCILDNLLKQFLRITIRIVLRKKYFIGLVLKIPFYTC